MSDTRPIINVITEAIDEWTRKNCVDEKIFKGRIKETLDKNLDKIIPKLLGFDDRWSRWEVDHCNGRAGESAAGDYLRSKAKEAVTEWLDKQAGDLPPLPKAAIDDLRKRYRQCLESSLREEVENIARLHARRMTSNIFEHVDKIICDDDLIRAIDSLRFTILSKEM